MDAVAFGALLGARAEADGAQAGLRDALKACEILQDRVKHLELALAVEEAHSAGLKAQVSGYASSHPESPMLADSGKRYKSGNRKTAARLLYEAAFDAVAATKLIDPLKHRAD